MGMSDASVFEIKDILASSTEDKTKNGKAFCVTTNDITSGTGGAETPQMYISNPENSGKIMKIYEMSFGTNVSSNNNIFRLYKSPTVSVAGTKLNNVSLCFSPAQFSSVVDIYKTPTVTNNGTLFMNVIAGPTSTNFVPLKNQIYIHPGYKMLINVRPNANSVTFSLNVLWLEEDS